MSDLNNAWSLDKVRDIIQKSQKPNFEEQNGPKVAFLPEGIHKIRWFFDPTGELFRESMSNRVGRTRFMCPDFAARQDRLGNYPECAICKHQKEKEEWRGRCRYNCMVYGHLYETKNPSEYWQPDTTYVILGNSKLRNALIETLENLVDDGADMLMGMLTPTVKGFISNTNVTRGTAGGVSVQVLTKMVDPIELGDWYIPLSEVTYVPSVFDSETYEAAVEEYFENLEAKTEKEDGEDGDEETDEVEVVETSDDDSDDDEEESEEDDDEDGGVAVATQKKSKVTPAKTAAKKASTRAKSKAKATASDMPDGITLEMLPDDCPGWSLFRSDNPVCVMCDYNVDCIAVSGAE